MISYPILSYSKYILIMYILSLLLVSIGVSMTAAFLVCKVDMVPTTWYEPEYEFVPIELRPTTWNLLGNETETRPLPRPTFVVFYYGILNEPNGIQTGVIEITDSAGKIHELEYGTNGTHMCVATDVASKIAGGYTSLKCVQQCHEVYSTDWREIIFFSDDISDPPSHDHLTITTTRATVEASLSCHDEFNYCPYPNRCVISVVKATSQSSYQLHADCQPENVTCPTEPSREPICVSNTPAPYIGNESYHEVCTYCCGYNRCNDVTKCDEDTGFCVLYGPPAPPTTSPSTTAGGATDGATRRTAETLSIGLIFICSCWMVW